MSDPIRYVIVAAFTVTMLGTASADTVAAWKTGNKLAEYCEHNPSAALLYIQGVDDGMTYAKTRSYCIPERVIGAQAQEVVCRYIARKPQDRHLVAADLIRSAFQEVWPCPK